MTAVDKLRDKLATRAIAMLDNLKSETTVKDQCEVFKVVAAFYAEATKRDPKAPDQKDAGGFGAIVRNLNPDARVNGDPA